MREERRIFFLVSGFCIVLITSCALLGMSFDVVKPTEVGIMYDTSTMHILSNRVYSEGRYFTGLGREFITFPTTFQTILFGASWAKAFSGDIYCRAKDGMVVRMEIAVQYRLSQAVEDLVRLHLDFGGKHENAYAMMVIKVVQNVASQFYSPTFWRARQELHDEIMTQLEPELYRVYASVGSVQIINMEFSASYATAIEETQVAMQDILQAEAEKNVAIVRSESAVAVAQETARIQLATAHTTANATIAQADAEAEAMLFRSDKQVEAYEALRDSLGYSDAGSLLAYSTLSALEDSNAKSIALSLQYPQLLKNVLGM